MSSPTGRSTPTISEVSTPMDTPTGSIGYTDHIDFSYIEPLSLDNHQNDVHVPIFFQETIPRHTNTRSRRSNRLSFIILGSTLWLYGIIGLLMYGEQPVNVILKPGPNATSNNSVLTRVEPTSTYTPKWLAIWNALSFWEALFMVYIFIVFACIFMARVFVISSQRRRARMVKVNASYV